MNKVVIFGRGEVILQTTELNGELQLGNGKVLKGPKSMLIIHKSLNTELNNQVIQPDDPRYPQLMEDLKQTEKIYFIFEQESGLDTLISKLQEAKEFFK